MPYLTIAIDEQQEAKIRDLIDSRQSFRVTGGTVIDSDGKPVFMKGITFEFLPDSYDATGQPRPTVEVPREGRLQS